MKKILLSFLALSILSCSNENEITSTDVATSNNITAKPATVKASVSSTSNFSDYNIAVNVSPDGSEWTYTITKAKASAKTLSHFIIDLNNCGDESATFGDILWATVNGVPTDLSPSEGQGTTCNPEDVTNNFVKFPEFSAASSWTLVLKFDRGYETFATAAVWVKAGTSCNQGVIPAPGCPKEKYCSFSQGYFFGQGSKNNGAEILWANGVTIGGITYTKEQGNNAWDIDRGPGGDITMNAFFQAAAVRLSGVESQVATDIAIIDAYFKGMDIFSKIATGTQGNNKTYQYFNLPVSVTDPITNVVTTTAMVDAAGTRIAAYIEANHCK